MNQAGDIEKYTKGNVVIYAAPVILLQWLNEGHCVGADMKQGLPRQEIP
jgi:hypothetical protein